MTASHRYGIEPWGDRAGDLPVLGRPLSQWQYDALNLPKDIPGHLSSSDDLWITKELAHAFARSAAKRGKPASLALDPGLLTGFAGALQEVEKQGDAWVFPLSWTPDPPSSADAPRAGAHPGLVVDARTKALPLPIHEALVPSGQLVLPLTARSCVRVTHWLHLLRANQLALLAHGHDLLHTRPMRLLGAALRARSVNQHKVMARLTQRGPGCDIHPTAVVEASVLGAGVKVGAHAVVRHSHLCDNAIVGDQANVVSSVLGPGASAGRMGMLQSCVLMAGANTGHFGHQLCIVGRNTFIGGEVILADFTPTAGGTTRVSCPPTPIRTPMPGATRTPSPQPPDTDDPAPSPDTAPGPATLRDAGTALLGCAVGHRTRLMAGLYVAPGRAIPSDLTVIGPQTDVLRRLPAADALAAASSDAVWSPDGQGGLAPVPHTK